MAAKVTKIKGSKEITENEGTVAFVSKNYIKIRIIFGGWGYD